MKTLYVCFTVLKAPRHPGLTRYLSQGMSRDCHCQHSCKQNGYTTAGECGVISCMNNHYSTTDVRVGRFRGLISESSVHLVSWNYFPPTTVAWIWIQHNWHSSRGMENNWPLLTDHVWTNILLCTINTLQEPCVISTVIPFKFRGIFLGLTCQNKPSSLKSIYHKFIS
jgi:hypothetical protein